MFSLWYPPAFSLKPWYTRQPQGIWSLALVVSVAWIILYKMTVHNTGQKCFLVLLFSQFYMMSCRMLQIVETHGMFSKSFWSRVPHWRSSAISTCLNLKTYLGNPPYRSLLHPRCGARGFTQGPYSTSEIKLVEHPVWGGTPGLTLRARWNPFSLFRLSNVFCMLCAFMLLFLLWLIYLLFLLILLILHMDCPMRLDWKVENKYCEINHSFAKVKRSNMDRGCSLSL